MKRTLLLLLATAAVFSMTACGAKKAEETGGTAGTEATASTSAEATQETETIDYTNWGVRDSYWANVDGDIERYYINLPYRTGGAITGGFSSDQGDGTIVILAGQNNKMPEITSISETFPACWDHLQNIFESIYGIGSKNFVFTLESDEPVQINDYDMHRFLGSVSFELSGGEPKNLQFVAYATTLKSNGGIVYWVVFDRTSEQTNGELIQQHAYNMAHTFREESPW